MGYMGLGMRKEDYTRKPRKAFKNLKLLLETELYNCSGSKNFKGKELTQEQIAAAKQRVKHELIKRRKRDVIITVFSIVVSSIAVLLIILWFDLI